MLIKKNLNEKKMVDHERLVQEDIKTPRKMAVSLKVSDSNVIRKDDLMTSILRKQRGQECHDKVNEEVDFGISELRLYKSLYDIEMKDYLCKPRSLKSFTDLTKKLNSKLIYIAEEEPQEYQISMDIAVSFMSEKQGKEELSRQSKYYAEF